MAKDEDLATKGKAPSKAAAKGDPATKAAAAAADAPAGPAEQPAKADAPDHRSDFPGVRLEHAVTVAATADGQPVHTVHPDDLFAAVRSVRDQGYAILSCLSAYDAGNAFGVFYSFVKPAGRPEEFGEFRLRCEVAKPEDKDAAKDFVPRIPSIVDTCPAANWQEREAYDMYGIQFDGHPDLRRIFLPEGWKGHPMRKDYAEPEQFVAMREGDDIVLSTQEEGSW